MNGPSYLIITTGYIALSLLVFILFMPIAPALSNYIGRRSLGIITFVYALIHYLLYILDNNIEWMLIRNDLFFRNYIQFGYVALIFFLPLFITSNNYAKEFLGNIVRYIVNIKDHLLILDTLHEADKKIYSSNEEITFYIDAEKIKFL